MKLIIFVCFAFSTLNALASCPQHSSRAKYYKEVTRSIKKAKTCKKAMRIFNKCGNHLNAQGAEVMVETAIICRKRKKMSKRKYNKIVKKCMATREKENKKEGAGGTLARRYVQWCYIAPFE